MAQGERSTVFAKFSLVLGLLGMFVGVVLMEAGGGGLGVLVFCAGIVGTLLGTYLALTSYGN